MDVVVRGLAAVMADACDAACGASDGQGAVGVRVKQSAMPVFPHGSIAFRQERSVGEATQERRVFVGQCVLVASRERLGVPKVELRELGRFPFSFRC